LATPQITVASLPQDLPRLEHARTAGRRDERSNEASRSWRS